MLDGLRSREVPWGRSYIGCAVLEQLTEQCWIGWQSVGAMLDGLAVGELVGGSVGAMLDGLRSRYMFDIKWMIVLYTILI